MTEKYDENRPTLRLGSYCDAWIYYTNNLRANIKAGGSGPTTPTLVRPKILPFAVKVLYLQNFGRTNNCVVEVFLKWSDKSRTPSAAHEYARDLSLYILAVCRDPLYLIMIIEIDYCISAVIRIFYETRGVVVLLNPRS